MPLIDYLVFTPLDEEWRTVRRVLSPKKINSVPTDPITYYLWKQPVNRPHASGDYLIVAAPMFRKTGGQALAGVISAHGLRLWKPSRVVLIGIAGSLEPNRLQLGDVVVSDEIFGYEVGDAEGSKYKFRPTFNQLEALGFDRVRAFRDDPVAYPKWQQECLKAATEVGLERVSRPPELHLEATASGNLVVKSVGFGRELRRQLSPKIKAVEMEARGLYQALYVHARRTDALMIRGVSDYADTKKSRLEKTTKDAWRTFSAANAARLLRTIWRRGPEQPISASYHLDLTLGTYMRFRQSGVPSIEFKRVGAQNNAFPTLLNRNQPTPELKLLVTAVSEAGKPSLNYRGLCIVDSPKRTIISGQEQNGKMTFELPASEWGLKAELLLSFPFGVNEIKVICEDNFQRVVEKSIARPKRGEEKDQ